MLAARPQSQSGGGGGGGGQATAPDQGGGGGGSSGGSGSRVAAAASGGDRKRRARHRARAAHPRLLGRAPGARRRRARQGRDRDRGRHPVVLSAGTASNGLPGSLVALLVVLAVAAALAAAAGTRTLTRRVRAHRQRPSGEPAAARARGRRAPAPGRRSGRRRGHRARAHPHRVLRGRRAARGAHGVGRGRPHARGRRPRRARPARPGPRARARRLHGGLTVLGFAALAAVTALSITWSLTRRRLVARDEPHGRLPRGAGRGRRARPPRPGRVVGAARGVAIASLVVCGWALATKVFPGALAGTRCTRACATRSATGTRSG